MNLVVIASTASLSFAGDADVNHIQVVPPIGMECYGISDESCRLSLENYGEYCHNIGLYCIEENLYIYSDSRPIGVDIVENFSDESLAKLFEARNINNQPVVDANLTYKVWVSNYGDEVADWFHGNCCIAGYDC